MWMPVALGEDETAHLRVPPAGLVAEMDTGLEQVLELRLCHAGATCLPFEWLFIAPAFISRADPRRGTGPGIRRCEAMAADESARYYRLLNWKRFRAPGRPGFLRSTARASRVSRPAVRSLVRCWLVDLHERAGDARGEARPACPACPPPSTCAFTSNAPERVGRGERLLDVLHQRRTREVVTERAAVDVPLARTRRQVHPRHAGLAAADGLPAEFGSRGHALALDGVTENCLGCCAACGCSAPP